MTIATRVLRSVLGEAKRQSSESQKYAGEERFWRQQVVRLLQWYEGELPLHYGTGSPDPSERVCHRTVEHSAILTWFNLHQKPKYLVDLQLAPNAFDGMRVLDVGCGPMPSAEAFENCERYCLDPLIPEYLKAGYPLHYYRTGTRFVHGYSEAMPFNDDFFDAIISVNAIDHVDDIHRTALEIGRVLKPRGLLRIHAHYHKVTRTEPLELNDDVMAKAFEWCSDFKKIHESDEKMGWKARRELRPLDKLRWQS